MVTLRTWGLRFGVAFATLLIACTAHAAVMQSTNYRLQSDSINIGGARGTSSSYALEGTVGEVGTGLSSSTSYNLSAGYQQTLVNYLAMTGPQNVVMSPTLGGVTGGTANGSTTVIVTTDDPAGYQLTITASTSPAMKSGANSIADYVPGGAAPDFTFGIAPNTGTFGFSPEGTDIAQRYKDNGSACNTGSTDTSLACWDGLSTTARVIASKTSGNHPNGTQTTIRFRTGLGTNSGIPNGDYYATTTLTAVAL